MVSNLYPPIIDTYMPAFAIDSGICRIYFSLSKYNSKENIKSIWVTVNNQFTNESVLNTPTGLLSFSSLEEDNTRNGDDKYYITVNNSNIKDGWTLNQLYKVQIRFSSEANISNTQSEIIKYENTFSEWSTVCLIQPISIPTLHLKNFSSEVEGNETIFTSLDNTVVGEVVFADSSEEDSLESYRLKIYNRNDLQTIVYDSLDVYTNDYNPNEINHFINYSFIDGEQYTMLFSFKTSSLYESQEEFNFTIIGLGGEFLDAEISAEPDPEEGRIKIHIYSDTNRFFGNLTIRRASSETNFNIWEDIHTAAIASEDFLDFTWYDHTARSGVWYKYCVQKRSIYGDRGLIVAIKEPVMITLQDMFLVRGNKQLKIKYNPKVSSFKHVVSDSLTQTLGSKYPFIKRNGSINYKQFSISGLITHFMDEGELFMSKDERYMNQKDLYMKYNEENRITEYNDFTLERVFREKVEEFLYGNDVKLFKSAAEGNVLVRLMDVSLSPEERLGRMVYTFSATAHEIDDLTFENFEKYGIQSIGTVKKHIVNSYSVAGRYLDSIEGSVLSKLQEHETNRQSEGLEKKITGFKKINLSFESDPYLINAPSEGDPVIVTKESTTSDSTVLGHLIKVNGNAIIVGANGQYSIESKNDLINDVVFVANESVAFDYEYQVEEFEAKKDIPQRVYYTSRVGQYWGWNKVEDSIYEQINDKYEQYYPGEAYQKMFALNSIQIEADPNTIFYIQTKGSNSFDKFVIGPTGYLNIESLDLPISNIYTMGLSMVEKPKIIDDENHTITEFERTKENEFIETRIYCDDFYDAEKKFPKVPNPIENGVYYIKYVGDFKKFFSVSGNEYLDMLASLPRRHDSYKNPATGRTSSYVSMIYHKGNWYYFTENNEIMKPSQVLIDYHYELEKGEFYSV